MNPRTKTLNIGESFEINIIIQGLSIENVDWETDNDKVAIVNGNIVSAISPGFARISARVPGTTNYDICTIIVCENKPHS